MKKVFFALALFFGLPGLQAQKDVYKLVNTFHISSSGGWDYLATNNNRLYVSHSVQVNILDKNTGDSVGYIQNTMGVHGIAFNNELHKGYTSNGRANTVTVFDLENNNIEATIATGKNPDAIMYEPFSKSVITCNGSSQDLSVIDAASEKLIATIPVGGKPETAVSDGRGKIYVNIEDKNEIVVVDTKTFTVTDHWSLAPDEAPTGLAIDIETHRLFSACGDSKKLVVLDVSNGKITTRIPIGDGCDGVGFDAAKKIIYTSNGADGTMTIIKEETKDKFTVLNTFITKRGARTITVDPVSHAIYLPTAEFEPASVPGTRPKILPGSFQVLMVKF